MSHTVPYGLGYWVKADLGCWKLQWLPNTLVLCIKSRIFLFILFSNQRRCFVKIKFTCFTKITIIFLVSGIFIISV